jgi:hypothetical protein
MEYVMSCMTNAAVTTPMKSLITITRSEEPTINVRPVNQNAVIHPIIPAVIDPSRVLVTWSKPTLDIP